MRKLRETIFIIMAALILFAAPVHAEKTIYKAGIVNDYKFPGNDVISYGQSCLKDVFSYLDNSGLDFSEYNLNDAVDALNSGSVNFIAMIPKYESLNEYFDYTDEPVGTGFLSLFARNDAKLYFEDYKKLDGAKIAILSNSYFEDMLSDYAAKHQFTYSPVYFDTIDDMVNAVDKGIADAMLTPATTSPGDMRLIAKCGSFDYYCAAGKGDSEMLGKLNRIMSSMASRSPFYLSSGYEKNFSIPFKNMVALTEDDYLTVEDQKQLRVLVPDNRYPMAYYNIEDGEYEGIYIDILRQITDNAGLELKFVPDDQKDMTVDSITYGKADALLTVSGSTEGFLEATDPYTTMSFMAVGIKDNDISAEGNLNIGIVSDDLWITDYLTAEHPQWITTEYHSINALLRAAEYNKVDAALICTPDMQTKTSLLAHPKLSIIQDFTVDVPVSLGISRVTCRQQVVNMLDGIIQNVSVPNAEIENKAYTLSHIYIPNFRDMLYANKSWIILILLVFAGIFVYIKRREGYFKQLARTDALTHIYNKRYFYKAAERIMAKSPDRPYLLASVDAKNFKLINDRFGTVIGDQTLVSIASKIKNIFDGKGLYGRMEGDSFLVLAEDTEENRVLLQELEKIDIHIHDSTNYHVPIKIGVCPITKYESEVPLSGYIDKANIAKEDAEGISQNYLRYFTGEMASQLDTKNDIEVDMVPALNRGDFIVYYQPKYELAHNGIIGAEALVRWNHKDKGLIPPGIFVPIFERNGFIVEVDFNVYESVFKMLKKRINLNQPLVTVSMNVSRAHLSDPKFAERLDALVDKYKIPKELIEMEITESIFSEGDNSAFDLVYELKRRGFSISMDDFGSGYSSLNLLRKMPIDTLKIDKVFIDDIEHSERSLRIVEQVIALANKINVKTICEGVETEAQRDILKSAGCDMVQGYYYSKPLPEADFEELLNKEN